VNRPACHMLALRLSLAAPAVIAMMSLQGCASDQQGEANARRPPRQCFSSSSPTSFRAVNDRLINIRVGAGDVFTLEATFRCPGIDFNRRLSFSRQWGSSICVGDHVTVLSRSAGRTTRCDVRVMSRLTPEEVEQLAPRHRP